jgi:aryl-alcohol dehydrogenase-like predicted oxidoreductase
MDYVQLGFTGIRVSRISLGTVFRSEPDEAKSVATVHRAADLGCNFLDCANIYRDGLSERIVGKAIKGRRDQFVVTTKVGSPTAPDINGEGLSRKNIFREVEASLSRLDTDYIDLYLCHFPDPRTPIEETVQAMDDLVRQGKIRYPGCSNFAAWQLSEALGFSTREHLYPFACNQVLYNMLDRHIEDELIPYVRRCRVAITVFAATAIGLLSGRYRYGQPPPPGSSWARGPYNYRVAMTRKVDRVIQAVIEIAQERG